jgi:[ribosomal protein S18]-alanine N-acetyltransferase
MKSEIDNAIMINYTILSPADTVGMVERDTIADFLSTHLDQYGDAKGDILKALDYALDRGVRPGGFVVVARDQSEIIGVVVINKTGMSGYIPENILVYIAMHSAYRGKGLGRELMERAIGRAEGGIALHVEPDNPARKLYEKLGFTNKYLEMRLTK